MSYAILYHYHFVADNFLELHAEVHENTNFNGLNYFYIDSFNALNEGNGKISFAQSANIRTHEITNIPVHAIRHNEPLTGQLFFEDGVLNFNIFGVAKELNISNYSLLPNINHWLVDNTLIVSSTVLSSFIGLLIAQIVNNNRVNKKTDKKDEGFNIC